MARNSVTAHDWKDCVQHILKEEESLWQVDGLMETVTDRLVVINNSRFSDSPDDRSEKHESDDGNCATEGIEPLQDL